MILEIDAGNTAIKWRVINRDGAVVLAAKRLLLAQIVELKKAIIGLEIENARIACVAGEDVRDELSCWVKEGWGVTPGIARTQKSFAGLTVSYSDPQRLGVDRWLAMLAAHKDCGKAVCVIDCGSAITADFVTTDGLHQGGYIVPGLRLMKKAVLGDTRQISMTGGQLENRIHWGKSTDEAVSFGIFRMAVKFLESIFTEIKQSDTNCRVYITGGDADQIKPMLRVVEDLDIVWSADLVFDGLAVALP